MCVVWKPLLAHNMAIEVKKKTKNKKNIELGRVSSGSHETWGVKEMAQQNVKYLRLSHTFPGTAMLTENQ